MTLQQQRYNAYVAYLATGSTTDKEALRTINTAIENEC